MREYLDPDILGRIPLTATNRRTGQLATDDSFCVCGMEIETEAKVIYEENWRNTEFRYPSFHRENRAQSEVINNLIEKNVMEIIEKERSRFASGQEFYLNLTYEIKYISDSFISIAFTGKGGRRSHPEDRFYTLNIDVKKRTTVGPRGLTGDRETEQIFHSLKAGQFESIRRWKSCMPDPFVPDIGSHSPDGREANLDRAGVQFYVCGDSFVVVSFCLEMIRSSALALMML